MFNWRKIGSFDPVKQAQIRADIEKYISIPLVRRFSAGADGRQRDLAIQPLSFSRIFGASQLG
jgi:hypothetical protein